MSAAEATAIAAVCEDDLGDLLPLWQTALDNTRAQALYDRIGARCSQWLDYDLPVS